ncbi:MAG: RNA helicase, partial [Xanthomonadaceae bacterium]|nr:RNA helicase [Xanthomonadaceae bacterium]
ASGLRAAAIHGNKSQNARTKALADFKSSRITVLVATDIAARGIDIDQLPMVINFDLPTVAEDYVHRIGRTGRAGSEGMAVSLVSHDESGLLRDIRKLLKDEIAVDDVAGFEPSTPLRLDAGAPRPKQGQRQPRAPQRAQGGQSQRASGQGASQAHRPHGHAQKQGGGEHAAGNRKRRHRPRPAAKA